MTITLLAPDGVPVTAQQERQARAAMYGGTPSRPLGGRSGFRPGTPTDTLAATSTTWTLKPCAAMIDPGASTHQGMYGWASDANIAGAVTAADATNPRKDIVYILVNDSTAGDGSGAVNASPVYLAGTPGVTPTAAAVPPRGFLVGTIDVPKVGGGSPTVTLNTARFAAAGAPLQVFTQAERDGLDKFDGLTVRRMDLPGRPTETWDNAAWVRTGVKMNLGQGDNLPIHYGRQQSAVLNGSGVGIISFLDPFPNALASVDLIRENSSGAPTIIHTLNGGSYVTNKTQVTFLCTDAAGVPITGTVYIYVTADGY